MYRFTGYHGTDQTSANNIIRTKYFLISRDDEDLLGPGIYFYEDHIQHAINYCNKKNFPQWSVIVCNIEAEIIIDLTNPCDFEQFNEIALKLQKSYLKKRDGRPRKLLNFVVFNAIYNIKPYDLARGSFNSGDEYIPTQ